MLIHQTYSKNLAPQSWHIKFPLYINKNFNKRLTTIFKNWFLLSTDFYILNTCLLNLRCFVVPPHKTKLYGRNLVNMPFICHMPCIYGIIEIRWKYTFFIIHHQLSLNLLSKNLFRYLQLIFTHLIMKYKILGSPIQTVFLHLSNTLEIQILRYLLVYIQWIFSGFIFQ